MYNTAFQRPIKPAVGQIVYWVDQYHNDRAGTRPYLVLAADGSRVHVVGLSHTPQGDWVTDELGGGTYLAGQNFRTGGWNGKWVLTEDLSRVQSLNQLSKDAQKGALDEAARQFLACVNKAA